jgi:diacylglycerol kinase (ATP)
VQQPSRKISAAKDLLLVNPVAGGGRAIASVPAIRELATLRGWNAEICITQSPVDLLSRIREAIDAGRQRIFVLGGDGTFQLLVNAAVGHPDSVLAVIPAGSGNDFAAALGLPSDPVQAATLLLDGEISQLDVLRVRTSDGHERLYVGGGGVGLDAEAVRHANGAYRNLPGRARYVLSAIHALVGFRSIRARVILGGESTAVEATALLVGALNTPTYGGGVRLAPEAKIDDGCLELVVVEELRVHQILKLLPVLAFKGKLETERIRRFTTSSVKIETDRPCWFHGDGEVVGLTPVEITVVPRAIRVLRPSRKTPDQ